MKHISVSSVGPIGKADLQIGDLTLFVGPQASGKSLMLQIIKLCDDRLNIDSTLEKNNYSWGQNRNKFLDLYFGENLSSIWSDKSKVVADGKEYSNERISFVRNQGEKSAGDETLFYIPAQRVLSINQGWPKSFGSFEVGDPFVLKQFSDTIRTNLEMERLSDGKNETVIFPKGDRLTDPLRKMISDGILNGSKISYDESSMRKRFVLEVGETKLPFMTWSAGQKEFMPLLLSLYYLLPASKISVRDHIKTVIIEEPEMGLYPKAIQALMIAFLELVSRGYKVIIATHSPVLLELLWTINFVKENKGSTKDLFALFGLEKQSQLEKIFKSALEKTKEYKTYYFEKAELGGTGTIVKDISSLDPGSEDNATANWGGITDFASRSVDVVANLAS